MTRQLTLWTGRGRLQRPNSDGYQAAGRRGYVHAQTVLTGGDLPFSGSAKRRTVLEPSSTYMANSQESLSASLRIAAQRLWPAEHPYPFSCETSLSSTKLAERCWNALPEEAFDYVHRACTRRISYGAFSAPGRPVRRPAQCLGRVNANDPDRRDTGCKDELVSRKRDRPDGLELHLHDSPTCFRMVLRGSLEGVRNLELRHAWTIAASILKGKEPAVDISELAGIDNGGWELLRQMRESGARRHNPTRCGPEMPVVAKSSDAVPIVQASGVPHRSARLAVSVGPWRLDSQHRRRDSLIYANF